jgi:hypothetical protein
MPTYSLTVLTRPHGHSKRKGGQVRFSTQQTSTLERRFSEHKYLSPEERRHLASQLKLSDRQVLTRYLVFRLNILPPSSGQAGLPA